MANLNQDWNDAAPDTVAPVIDHTLLKPTATSQDIRILCQEAIRYQFFSVCIAPPFVSLAHQQVVGTSVQVCTVIGFPLGSHASAVKAFEAERAHKDGAKELDMVLAIGALKEKNYSLVEADIRAVVSAAPESLVKVILETCYLTDEEIKTACLLAVSARARFVKTSTGFGSGGATENAVRIMRQAVGSEIGVKASGGIRDFSTLKKMLLAGATRIGCSSGVQILNQQGSTHDY